MQIYKKYNIMKIVRAAALHAFGPLRWVKSING